VEAPEILDIGQNALWTMLKIGAPTMMVALVVGLVISLFQALTQIQEMTLTFVPKIVAIVAALLLFMPFMLTSLTGFTQGLFDRIASGS
jgi:flagellar biosynthetic protein FliQ